MNYVFKCKPHSQQAIYINVKPDDKEPILLCSRCILDKNYTAKLLEEFLEQEKPLLGQNLEQDVLYFDIDKKSFNDQLDKLQNTLLDVFKTRLSFFSQKLRQQYQEQTDILQQIKTSILHYQKIYQKQNQMENKIEVQLRNYLLHQQQKNQNQKQTEYLYSLLKKASEQEPYLNIQQICEDFHESLDQFSDKLNFSNPIQSPNYQLSIFSPEDIQNIEIYDFNISKTLILNNYYPELNAHVGGIENLQLHLQTSIDLFGFNVYHQLKELYIHFNNCNVGLSKQLFVPNLQKLSLNFKGNQLEEFVQIMIPETVTEYQLDLSQNLLDENCIYPIGQSIDNLKLKVLKISFDGFSVIRNKIWDTGLIQLCRVLFSQQLEQLHLGLGNCSITNIGVDYGIIKLLQKQRNLKALALNLYSNQINNLSELSKHINSIKNVKINANSNPLENSEELNQNIFKTRNCEFFFKNKRQSIELQ